MQQLSFWYAALAVVTASSPLVDALKIDVTDVATITNATSTIAFGLMKYYTGNVSAAEIGILPAPYYWWEAGAMWMTLIDYWYFTNDTTYNNETLQALVSQIGPTNNYMVPAQNKDEGNDDQVFWGFAAMSAVERNFTATPTGSPSWLALADGVFNSQVERWDTTSCNGGLKWQIYTYNLGYDYKNAISNGGLLQLAARLARYTGNQTYVDWVDKIWDWSTTIGLVDNSTYNVYDGSDDTINCTQIDHTLYSYNLAVYLYGSAMMYNYTNGSTTWENRTTGLLKAASAYFSPFPNSTDIMYEPSCELSLTCDTDAQSFKSYLSAWMWETTRIAPYTTDAIVPLLQASAQGAAASCSGGDDGVTCGSKWYIDGWDGTYGVGQQLSALGVLQGLLINDTAPPQADADVHFGNVSASSTSATSLTSLLPTSTGDPSPAATTTHASKKSTATSNVLRRQHTAGSIVIVGIALSLAAFLTL